MARRKRPAAIPDPTIDAEVWNGRFRQLARRMRCALPLEGERYNKLKRAIASLDSIEDPAQALASLLDLADELRTTLPPGALPDGLIERWRAELARLT